MDYGIVYNIASLGNSITILESIESEIMNSGDDLGGNENLAEIAAAINHLLTVRRSLMERIYQ